MPWKPYRTYSEKARHVIETNNYVTVATTDNEGNPWAAPVFFAYDKDYNLYFLSAVDSRHAENLAQNPNIAAVIFDSTSPVGQSDGVQLEGKVIPVERKAVAKVINIYCKRLFPNSDVPATERYIPDEYSGASEFRFFKITIVKAYTTGEDRRVEVDFNDKEEK